MRLLTKGIPVVENVTSRFVMRCKQCRFHLSHQRYFNLEQITTLRMVDLK